jgi:serine/threonine protein kinase
VARQLPLIKYLGKGTFGNVILDEDKEKGKQYAMKIIEKKKIKEFKILLNAVFLLFLFSLHFYFILLILKLIIIWWFK